MKKPYTFKLNPKIHQLFKLQAVKEDKPMVEILTDLILEYLIKQEVIKDKSEIVSD